MLSFDPWHLWVILAIVLVIAEMFTPGFFLFCLAVGAFFTALLSVFFSSLIVQLFCFSLAALLSSLFIRPFILKITSKGAIKIQTGVNALIGEKALVLEDFGGFESYGSVKVRGEIWRAFGKEDERFLKGESVFIISIEGISLLVSSSKIER